MNQKPRPPNDARFFSSIAILIVTVTVNYLISYFFSQHPIWAMAGIIVSAAAALIAWRKINHPINHTH